MGFPDFPIPERDRSYLTRQEIWDFLDLYADRFRLKPLIRFNRHVLEVRPLDGGGWRVASVDKPTGEVVVGEYDAVMVCNGHYNDPYTPRVEGREKFAGHVVHSHAYRRPEPYRGKRVLCVGAGPSGLDLALQISGVAKFVSGASLSNGNKVKGSPTIFGIR